MTANIRLLIVVNVLALVVFVYALRLAPPLDPREPVPERSRVSQLLTAQD
jgi:hypothetical protein